VAHTSIESHRVKPLASQAWAPFLAYSAERPRTPRRETVSEILVSRFDPCRRSSQTDTTGIDRWIDAVVHSRRGGRMSRFIALVLSALLVLGLRALLIAPTQGREQRPSHTSWR
jgi:hypothetical protein